MKKIYKNWFVHNMFSHPISEIVYWLIRPFSKTRAHNISGVIHDSSIPLEYEEGRG